MPKISPISTEDLHLPSRFTIYRDNNILPTLISDLQASIGRSGDFIAPVPAYLNQHMRHNSEPVSFDCMVQCSYTEHAMFETLDHGLGMHKDLVDEVERLECLVAILGPPAGRVVLLGLGNVGIQH